MVPNPDSSDCYRQEAAKAAAVRQWEEEKGGGADSVDAEEEPAGR